MNKMETQTPPQLTNLSPSSRRLNRRAFLGRMATGAALLAPAGVLAHPKGKAKGHHRRPNENGLTEGDAALLRFAAAAEILETDFWVQYNELAGIPDSEVPGGTPITVYQNAIIQLDADMPSTSTIIPRMSSLTSHSLTRTWYLKVRRQLTSIRSKP
jgi:hypothetical protein